MLSHLVPLSWTGVKYPTVREQAPSSQQWCVRVTVGSELKNLGCLGNKDLAERVSEYTKININKPDMVTKARALLKRLKRSNGERVRNDEHLLSLGSGRELLENAADLGADIINRGNEIPNG